MVSYLPTFQYFLLCTLELTKPSSIHLFTSVCLTTSDRQTIQTSHKSQTSVTKCSGVARPVKMGGQAVGNAVFQVGKGL